MNFVHLKRNNRRLSFGPARPPCALTINELTLTGSESAKVRFVRHAFRNHGHAAASGLRYRSASLVAEENQVCAASHTEFGEQVGDMKFHGALGDVQSVRDFLVG